MSDGGVCRSLRLYGICAYGIEMGRHMRHGRLSIPFCLALLAAGVPLHGEYIRPSHAETTRQVEAGHGTRPCYCFGILGQVGNPAVYQFRTPTVRVTDLV